MNEIISKALELGAVKAQIINSSDLRFDRIYRKYCADNRCGFYNNNYMCPPHIGTYNEVTSKVLSYEKGVFFQSISPIEGFSDSEGLESAAARHNTIAQNIRKYLREIGYTQILPMATKCRYCTPCAKTLGLPCAHPELAMGCLSAYCIDVINMAEKLSMDYNLGDRKIAYFGLVLFR